MSALVFVSLASLPDTAHADDSSTLTVVGTSDVFDSNLVQAVLKPGFEAYEQSLGNDVTLNYVSKGTGAAITAAEAGQASALLVHAASVENQFVQAGYSFEPFGRAIFYGDYVLLGPADDPAGVAANDPHDIAGAFEDIAAAGATGDAEFVSRGGTPGTTIQEHAIWLQTTGVTTCSLTEMNGGGVSPSTVPGPCPADPTPIPYPAWYHATGLNQGLNVQAGNACNFGAPSNDCYVFTDRGTFNYLDSQGLADNLHIVTRDNAATAPGGDTLLVNSFHAYAINPAPFAGNPAVQINLDGAIDFLDWVTSPAAQRAVGRYLSDSGDPPFLPDAAPRLTVTSNAPAVVDAGDSITVKGSLTNVVPGTPPLADKVVRLMATPAGRPGKAPQVVETTQTDDQGNYTLHYKPTFNATLKVTTTEIQQIENDVLDPPFGDLLSPASHRVGRVNVQSAVTVSKVTSGNGTLTVKGSLSPTAAAGATIRLYGTRTGPLKAGLPQIGEKSVKPGTKNFTVKFKLRSGTWRIQIGYVNPSKVLPSLTKPQQVKVR